MNIVKKIFFLLAFVLLNTVVNNAFADGVLKGTITSDWGNGFCYNFNVANTSGSNLTDWNVNFKLNTATSINSKWSGNFSNVSDIYTITPVDRNKTISANGSTDIGFCANGTDRPTSITLGSNTVNNSTTGTTNTTTTETLKDNLITKDGLSVNFVASSKRDGGYCRNITLKNTSSETISNWEISFLLDQAINGWSANYSKSGTKYTVKPMDWNKSINSNTQIEIGFCSVGKLFDKTQVIENVSFLSTTTPTTPTNSGSTTTTTTPTTPTTITNSGSTTTTTNSGSTAITTNTSINFPAEKWVTKGIDLNGDGLADINMQNTPWNISSAYGSSKLEYDTNLKTYKYSHDFSNIVQVDPSGWVHGYPEVFVGKKPWGGDYTQGYTHLPKLIKEINSLNFTTQYNLNNISGGPINFAAEGWIVPDKNRSTNVSGNEIEYMIMFFKENTGPAGNAIGTFTTQIKVNGQSVNETFTIYKARFAWDFFTFVPSKNYNGELIELDLAKFLPYIKQNISYNIDNYYLMNWEIGSEYGSPTVLNSKASWELKKFNLDVNSTAVNTTTQTNSGVITTVTKPNKLIGYYTSWDRYSYTYDKIDYSKFDIINHAFIFNNTDGTLSVPSDLLYPEFVNEVHKNGKKVVISVGNGSSPYNFATMAKNDTSRAKFVSEIKKFITTNNYDGVDIDWEYPIDQIEGDYYLKLMKDLKTALPDKLVTTAISINPSFIDVKLLSDTVDYVYIMAYDIEGGWNSYAGHNAPLYRNSKMPWDMSIDGFLNSKYLNANINKSKFILGLPLYGRKFYVAKPYDTAYYSETIEYKNLPKNCTELWDNESKVPYLSCGSYYISFDNLKSFKEKIDYINTKQLGGAFFWAIGQENGDLINGFK